MNITAAIEFLQSLCQRLPIKNHQLLHGQAIDILRLDMIHPVIQGNKAAKLLGHLEACLQAHLQIQPQVQPQIAGQVTPYTPNKNEISCSTNAQQPRFGKATDANKWSENPKAILSFGGRYSNHLHALANLGKQFEIPIIGLVQGYPEQALSHTLRDCLDWGMELVYQNKRDYARRYDSHYRAQLAQQHRAWVIAEGGGTDQNYADSGLAYWLPVLKRYRRVWLASGSGTTLFGLMRLLKREHISTQLIAVNCVADHGQLSQRVAQFNLTNGTHHKVIDDGHGGGFGRYLDGYCQRKAHYAEQGLAIEPIYMDKLLAAVCRTDLLQSDLAELIIHGGGLQGDAITESA